MTKQITRIVIALLVTLAALASVAATAQATPPSTRAEALVDAVIEPSKTDPLVSALRAAAGTDTQVTFLVDIRRDLGQVDQVAASGYGTTVVMRGSMRGPALYAFFIRGSMPRCPAGRLYPSAFHLCLTATVTRTRSAVRKNFSTADTASLGTDLYQLTSVKK